MVTKEIILGLLILVTVSAALYFLIKRENAKHPPVYTDDKE